MNIAIIGYGVIGARHAAILERLGHTVIFFKPKSYQVDTYQAELCIFLKTNNILVACITNPTSLHWDTLVTCVKANVHSFVEKPIANIYLRNEFIQLKKEIKRKCLTIMIGYDMRFSPWIQMLEKKINRNTIGSVWGGRIMAGQFLPDWRKGKDYREFYSARQKLGGGVLRDLSHEIDYLTWLINKPIVRVTSRMMHTKHLLIDTEDIVSIIFEYKDKTIIEMHLDYLTVPYRRSAEFYGSEGTMIWDDNEKTIRVYQRKNNRGKLIASTATINDSKNILEAEWKHFFSCIKDGGEPINSFANAWYVSQLIAAVEQSATQGKTVSLPL